MIIDTQKLRDAIYDYYDKKSKETDKIKDDKRAKIILDQLEAEQMEIEGLIGEIEDAVHFYLLVTRS